MAAQEDYCFWMAKLAALELSQRNHWMFRWPADPPDWWREKAYALISPAQRALAEETHG